MATTKREAALERAVRLVLSLHDHPGSNVPGYLVKLDPQAVGQLLAALEESADLVPPTETAYLVKVHLVAKETVPIHAIKELREMLGADLRTAKEIIESVRGGSPWPLPPGIQYNPQRYPHLVVK
jgi:hypothetical protein